MINQRVLEYIKSEQQKGTDRATITSSLLANGWSNKDIEEAYNSLPNTTTVPVKPAQTTKNVWAKTIQSINITFLILYVFLLLFVDLPTYLENVRRYQEYWYMMLGVFGAFVLFFLLETFVFRNAFKNTTSKLDGILVSVIVLRNLLVLLNVIPFIQLIGLFFGYFAGPVIIIIYTGLIIARYVKRPSAQAQMVS